MSNDRDTIFSSIRSALEKLPEKSAYPEWNDALPLSNNIDLSESLTEQFANRLTSTSGRYFDSVQELGEFLKTEGSVFGYCDPKLAELFSGIEGISFDTEYDMAKVDDYQFGITMASAAIAESGTIVLTDSETSARLGALSPWIHIAVIKEKDIVPSPLQAIERFGDDPSVIFCTGPSKTADVEGILIEGVHGPGVQVGLLIP
jgi:L-lactate dehydrogenase complex protein LldG